MTIDLTQSSEDIIFGLVESATQHEKFDREMFTLGEVVNLGTGEGVTHNTMIRLLPKPGNRLIGRTFVNYNRIQIKTIVPPVRRKGAVLLSEIIERINAAYGLNITEEDYTDTELPTFDDVAPGAAKYVNVAFKPTSRIYRGNFGFMLQDDAASLESVLKVRELDGFNLPAPT